MRSQAAFLLSSKKMDGSAAANNTVCVQNVNTVKENDEECDLATR